MRDDAPAQRRGVRADNMLRTSDLSYDLPPERIAIEPAVPRDSARLMVVRRSFPDRPEHLLVRDLPGVLASPDLLVFNTTRVLPARFRGVRTDTGGRVEGLYLRDASVGSAGGARWITLLKARRFRPGCEIRLLDAWGVLADDTLRLVGRSEEEDGAWEVEVLGGGASGRAGDAPSVLARVGLPPLPPYILAARRATGAPELGAEDREWYQTVYARADGSVAAPTAGLHFTEGLLRSLAVRGVGRAEVVLHVGVGTFKPVETEFVEEHPIHSERCAMSAGVVGAVERARAGGGRVVAVGTTSVRTLESFACGGGQAGGAAGGACGGASRGVVPSGGTISTRLLVTPGYRFALTDALLTNFHLPRSTLMALVASMLQEPDEPAGAGGTPPGVTRLQSLYACAAGLGYRFYSFGDAMLVLP